MYPKLINLFDGKFVVYTYSFCIAVGLILCALCFRFLTKKLKMSAKAYDFYSLLALISIVVGFIFAYLFQDLYHLLDTGKSNLIEDLTDWFNGGKFALTGGVTFMGGLVGGAGCFIIGTLLCKSNQIKKEFPLVADIAAVCIPVAHGFGRIGCFFGGCCYGKPTDSWLGVDFPNVPGDVKVHPTMLYEVLFCFIAAGILLYLILKFPKKGYLISIYAVAYSIFRFFIEFLRGDERNSFAVLSPSQIQSILLIVVCAVYVGIKLYVDLKGKSFIPDDKTLVEQENQNDNSNDNDNNGLEV